MPDRPAGGGCGRLFAVNTSLGFDPIAEAGRQWREHWGDATAAPMQAVTSIMRVQQILIARLNDVLDPFGLTFPRYEALMLLYLSRNGALPLGKMGARLQVHRTSVTNLVDGLEKGGLAVRSPHPTDRRTTLATITDEGRRAAEGATNALNTQAFGTEPLQPDELGAITDVLERLRVGAGDFSATSDAR
ncbi:MAG: MarR family transcriptional regulator [Aeromicrobium sp.]|jgi:DNA-binding MarR family transcriptional regulator|nr:MarR family transcriptional regulator [Aeromicrobium sp.]